MNKELQQLVKYPEFHAFKQSTLDYIEELKDEIANLNPHDASFAVESAGRVLSINALVSYLSRLGILSAKETKLNDKTYN